MKIRGFLKNGYNYSLNNNFKEARKEYSKVLEYEQNKIFKRLIITAKLNLYNTYHYDMINRQESLEYARINEENFLKELPNYHDRKHLIFSWYKYQYALLCCNLGNTYNELALMRDAKNNYNSSKKYSLQAVDMFRKINKLNSYYFSIFGTTYSNLAITYRGLANLSKESSLLQLSLNYAKKSLLIFEEVKDCYNIARIQNSIGNIYNDLINYKNNANKKETFYSNKLLKQIVRVL